MAASSSGARGCSRARAQLPVGSVAWPCPPLGQSPGPGCLQRPLAELAQQSSRHLPSPEPKRRLQCPREQEPGCGGQGPGLGGRNIPAPSPPQPCEDRPALPACPLTQASRSQAGLAPPTTPIHPNLLPHHFGSGTSPCWLGQEEMVSPGKKTMGKQKFTSPRHSSEGLIVKPCSRVQQSFFPLVLFC